jgi:hypothetical protein
MSYDYTSLPLVAKRDTENGLIYFGTVVDGAFIMLSVRKLGGFDAKVAEARDLAAQAQPAPVVTPAETEAPPPAPPAAG